MGWPDWSKRTLPGKSMFAEGQIPGGQWFLAAGDVMRFVVTGATASDDFGGWVVGYQMDAP